MKTTQLIRKSLARAAVAIGLGLGALGSAQAGLVTGNVDPPFGAVLPGVSYEYSFSFNIADACAGNAPGMVWVNCGPTPVSLSFKIYETANPGNFQTKLLALTSSWFSVLDGFVVGTSTISSGYFNDFEAGPVAPGKLFDFMQMGQYFMPAIGVGQSCGIGCVASDGFVYGANAAATVYHFDDAGLSKLGYTDAGEVIGYRFTRDSEGAVLIERTDAAQNNVPEPGSLALAALGLLLAARRRQT